MLADDLRTAVLVNEAGCWVWQHSCNSKGYSLVTLNGRLQLAHRVSYERYVGPIPAGLTIDHLCRNKPCINPEHLEPVTMRENMRRRPDVHKTHCIRNHALTPENTIIHVRKGGNSGRSCRTCFNASRRVRRATGVLTDFQPTPSGGLAGTVSRPGGLDGLPSLGSRVPGRETSRPWWTALGDDTTSRPPSRRLRAAGGREVPDRSAREVGDTSGPMSRLAVRAPGAPRAGSSHVMTPRLGDLPDCASPDAGQGQARGHHHNSGPRAASTGARTAEALVPAAAGTSPNPHN